MDSELKLCEGRGMFALTFSLDLVRAISPTPEAQRESQRWNCRRMGDQHEQPGRLLLEWRK